LPVAHYWFLGSLFIIFITVMVLESLRLLDHWRRFTIVLAVTVAIYLTMDPYYFLNPFYFDLARTVYLFPYFLCGLASSRFCIEKPHILPVAIVVFIGAWAYAAAGVIGYVPIAGRTSVIALLIGVTGSFVLMRLRWNNSGLAFIGLNAYAIYLFHVFFTASARMPTHALQINDIGVLFVVGTLAGVFFPILIGVVWFGKYRIGAAIRARLVGNRNVEAPPAAEPLNKIPRSIF
jgi:fucose 4-O-acetylase-like acetyltransferase